ncbi:MAG: Na+/H+ antiporter subunit E [Candidatus Polarisedimenticolaceae bacterium]|nr:Na+/H+ antiporter subunit E [Candidatus Polarisedimenticolaceae bacterium]
MKSYSFAALLFLFWVFLSGHLTPLLLGFGVASVALAVFLSKRMNVIDHESYPLHLSSQLPAFFLYIFKEIIKANIDVVKRILQWQGSTISPQLLDIPVQQASDLGRVIYANAITLTPGTVSIELSQDTITIHALTEEAAQELATGSMAREVSNRVLVE